MGTKRDINTGKLDTLGRPIKVSKVSHDDEKKAAQLKKEKEDRENEIVDTINDLRYYSWEDGEHQIRMSTDVLTFLENDDVWENSPDEAMRIAHKHGMKKAVLMGVISELGKKNGKPSFGASLGGGTKRCKDYRTGDDVWEEHLDRRGDFFGGRYSYVEVDKDEYGEHLVATYRPIPGGIRPMRNDGFAGGRHSSQIEEDVVDFVESLGYDVKTDHELSLDKFCYHNDHGGWEFGDVAYNRPIAPDLILPNEKIIIEVDGGVHHKTNIMDDVERTYRMHQQGWKVIRVRFGQRMRVDGKNQNIDIPYATNIHAHSSTGMAMRSQLKRAIQEAIGES